MGKSNSCFKIIACGNDSADKDDLEVSESKGSSDKRGWSFRKRSPRHRVLSNTVLTEIPTSGKKESSESAPLAFQSPASTTVSEKVSVIQCTDEKPQLLNPENPTVSATENASEDQSKVDVKLEDDSEVDVKLEDKSEADVKLEDESKFGDKLEDESKAQRSLLELENVVKLQAAVRGHLVRKHAVGTLRCVQAIVKMQALVRARQSLQKDSHSSKISKKDNVTYISIEKLLSNSFARQLLESTPKNQPIHVKCDLSKPDSDSAWKWMEMWMAVSTKDTPHLNEAEAVVEQQETKEEISESPLHSKIQYCEMEELNSSIKESIVLSESEESLITYDADNFNFQSSDSASCTVRDNNEQLQLGNTSTSAVKETAVEINLSDADSNMVFKALSEKPVIETEQPKHSMKRSTTDELETDGKKSVFGSRKVTNPAFIAAQSKFAELTSTTNSGRSVDSSLQDVSGVESQRDTFSAEVDSEVRKEPSVADNPVVPHESQVQVGGSECGTEISISSTLDSPDRSDVGAVECEHDHDVKVSEERICSPNNSINIDVETKDFTETPVSNSCNTVTEPDKISVNGETINSEVAMVSPQTESKPERTTSDAQREQETTESMQAYGSSPEASPRSHLTVPGSQQGTPSSQISVKAKRSKADKNGSNKKRMSLSAGKKSPSNPNHDSGSGKDHKNGKRRNSFGSTKPDQADQEPRDSSSSSTIPRFMQATESVKAKLLATTSPRSSPDAQDREIYIKKRHSLPGENGRQGSPRIQRSLSQAQPQQGAKGTERKWQR